MKETSENQILEEPATSVTEETEPTPQPESGSEDESELPVIDSRFASGVGKRGSNRLTKFFDRAGGWFGLGNKPEATINKDGTANLPLPDKPKPRLGRGGWTAIGVLLVLLPLLALTLFWAMDTNTQLQGYKYNLEQIEKGAISQDREGTFITILTSPKLQIQDMQSTDTRPIGSVRFYAADYKQWAIAYGGLVPTNQNNVYALWVVRLPSDGSQPGPNDYIYLTSFVNQPGGGHYLVVPENSFPSGFAYANFNRVVVTEEPGSKAQPTRPEGPVRFALDLTKIKLY
jgi:hypothetical protein